MHFMTADESMAAQLRGTMNPVEIRDENGKVLGQFVPRLTPEQAALFARLKEPFDLDEADRSAAEPGPGKTTAEVLEYLKTLGSQE